MDGPLESVDFGEERMGLEPLGCCWRLEPEGRISLVGFSSGKISVDEGP